MKSGDSDKVAATPRHSETTRSGIDSPDARVTLANHSSTPSSTTAASSASLSLKCQ